MLNPDHSLHLNPYSNKSKRNNATPIDPRIGNLRAKAEGR
jgi:hypothetical protein